MLHNRADQELKSHFSLNVFFSAGLLGITAQVTHFHEMVSLISYKWLPCSCKSPHGKGN